MQWCSQDRQGETNQTQASRHGKLGHVKEGEGWSDVLQSTMDAATRTRRVALPQHPAYLHPKPTCISSQGWTTMHHLRNVGLARAT